MPEMRYTGSLAKFARCQASRESRRKKDAASIPSHKARAHAEKENPQELRERLDTNIGGLQDPTANGDDHTSAPARLRTIPQPHS